MTEFGGGVHGVFFEQEEIKGTCRAAIRCTGKLFKRLVEGDDWQMRITWFEARPEFETFFETVRNFSIDQLGAITAPRQMPPSFALLIQESAAELFLACYPGSPSQVLSQRFSRSLRRGRPRIGRRFTGSLLRFEFAPVGVY